MIFLRGFEYLCAWSQKRERDTMRATWPSACSTVTAAPMQSFQFKLNLRRSNTTFSSADRIPQSYGNSFDLEYCKIDSASDTFMRSKLWRRNFREKKSDFNRSDKVGAKIEFSRTMNNNGNLIHNRLVILAIVIACVLVVFIKVRVRRFFLFS